MARGWDYPLGAAISTVRAGMSARAGLRAFRFGGGRTTDSTWFRTVAQARAMLADQLAEAGRPLNRRPGAGEITVVESRVRSGYWQQMTVFAQDRQTGEVYTSDFVVRGQGLLTRQAAIDFATAEWEAGSSGTPNPNDDRVLGVAYVSTLELQPAASPPTPTVTQQLFTPPSPPTPPLATGMMQSLQGLRGRLDLPSSGIVVGGGGKDSQTLMRGGGWVSLMDLRAAFPNVPRNVQDEALQHLARSGKILAVPEMAQYSMLDAERAAAWWVGGQATHWVWIIE